MIKTLYDNDGLRDWNEIAEKVPGRTAKQCRDRYQNYLSAGITNKPWTDEEDQILREKVREIGNKWKEISAFLPGRGSNNIKNRWHKVISLEPWATDLPKNRKGISPQPQTSSLFAISKFDEIENLIPSLTSTEQSIPSSPTDNEEIKTAEETTEFPSDFFVEEDFNLDVLDEDTIWIIG